MEKEYDQLQDSANKATLDYKESQNLINEIKIEHEKSKHEMVNE